MLTFNGRLSASVIVVLFTNGKTITVIERRILPRVPCCCIFQKNRFITLYQIMNDELFAKDLQLFSTYLPINNNITWKICFISTSNV